MMKRGKYALILKKYKYAAVVILIGILLLCWPAGETKEKEKTPAIEESLAETEERMEKILSEIEGAGELQLMLTVEAGSEQLLAREQSLSYSGAAASPEEYDRSETCVVISKGSGGEEVVVTKSIYPVYRGALIVCEGGSDPQVKLALTEAVSALTGLGAEKISVVKG